MLSSLEYPARMQQHGSSTDHSILNNSIVTIWLHELSLLRNAKAKRNAAIQAMKNNPSCELTRDDHSNLVGNIIIWYTQEKEALRNVLEFFLMETSTKGPGIYRLDLESQQVIECSLKERELADLHYTKLLADVTQELHPINEPKILQKYMNELHKEYLTALCDAREKHTADLCSLEKIIVKLHNKLTCNTAETTETVAILLLEALVKYTRMIQPYGIDILHFDLPTKKLNWVFVEKGKYTMPPYAEQLTTLRHTLFDDSFDVSQLSELHSTPITSPSTPITSPSTPITSPSTPITSPSTSHDVSCDKCDELSAKIQKELEFCRDLREFKNIILNRRKKCLVQMDKNPTYHFTQEQHELYLAEVITYTLLENAAEFRLYKALDEEARHGGPFCCSCLCPYHTVFHLKRTQNTQMYTQRYTKHLEERKKLVETPEGDIQAQRLREELTLEFRLFTSDVYVNRARRIRWAECSLKQSCDDFKNAYGNATGLYAFNPVTNIENALKEQLRLCKKQASILEDFVVYLRLIDPTVAKRRWDLDLSLIVLARIPVTPDYNPTDISVAYTARHTACLTEVKQMEEALKVFQGIIQDC